MTVRLQAVKADQTPSRRRPVRLTLLAEDRELAIELSRREAVELAEWLDETVTRGT